MKKLLLIVFVTISLGGCAPSSLNISSSPNSLSQEVNRIALMPSGGPLADAVGIELLNYGLDVIDAAVVMGHMSRYNLNELELSMPQNISKLSSYGIDTLLIVKGVEGYDGRPESVSARLISTLDGRLVIGVTWQNGKGGAQGSPADRMMRSSLGQAAKEIATGFGESLNK